MEQTIFAAISIALFLIMLGLVVLIVLVVRNGGSSQDVFDILDRNKRDILKTVEKEFNRQDNVLEKSQNQLRQELGAGIRNQTEYIGQNLDTMQRGVAAQMGQMSDGIGNLQQANTAQLKHISEAISTMQQSNAQQIDSLTRSVSSGMENIRTTNEAQLKEIKGTVDKELQETLDRRIKESFDSISKQMVEVQRGLGEMSVLASSVGDLKKTLSNTKTRGILGETQLGAILEQILSPGQYETNICTVPGSREPVEFAIKLPGQGDTPVYMPVDAKFPLETYHALLDAYDTGDKEKIAAAQKALETRLLSEGKDIHEKYIHPPETTEFGVMFLPIEGLYAEAIKICVVDRLQAKYHVIIAGPTTMSALLNTFQMGFRTVAIQKRSAEVWSLLGNVKTEFETFAGALSKTQLKLTQASNDLEALVGTRTRKITKQLAAVTFDPEMSKSMEQTITVNTEIAEE